MFLREIQNEESDSLRPTCGLNNTPTNESCLGCGPPPKRVPKG